MFRSLTAALVLAATVFPAGLAIARAPEHPAVTRPADATTRVVVEDPEGLMAAPRLAALKQRLAGVPGDGVAVAFSRRKAAGGIESQAEAIFDRAALGPNGVAIAVAVDDRTVGAHVGTALRARGVDREVITAAIGAHFKGHARQGRYDDGAAALAEAIAAHRATGRPARPAAEGPAPAGTQPADEWSDDTYFLFGLVILALTFGLPVLLVGALVWYFFFRRPGRRKSDPKKEAAYRVSTLEAARDRIAEGIVALDGAIALAGKAGDALHGPATAVMAEGQAFMPRVDAVRASFDGNRPQDVIEAADELDMTALNLEVSLAALRTAYQADGRDVVVVREALQLGRRFKLAEAQVAWVCERRAGTGNQRSLLTDLASKAREALTSVPHDLVHAKSLIDELRHTLDQLGLSGDEEQAANSARTSATVAATSGGIHDHLDCWDNRPVVVVVDDHHGHGGGWWSSGSSPGWSSASGSSDSGSSSWASSSSSADSGSSSWSSSDSGSSSWSSSDDDSNRWSSSSDSGSSSWDSGSSSSDSSSSSGSDSW